ncbi:MAG: class I SAM-dependent RNA methyltransferase [Actinobacteria bacterium]|nr:class I SAM-dependent RNA methyltransferase [Actinomycetota bacterium]
MIELTTTDIAHGGEAIARLNGKTHFVAGALPGEVVLASVVRDKGSWARADLVEVRQPSPDRIDPPCPHHGVCGGCQWQFAPHALQLGWKQEILAGQLSHIGGIDPAVVRPAIAPSEGYHYRNRMDFKVLNGRLALTKRRSRDLTPIDSCHISAPRIAELAARLGPLDGVQQITLRVSHATDDIVVVIRGRVPAHAGEWQVDVGHRDRREFSPVIGDCTMIERIGDVDLRISGDAFFQNNTLGAEVMVSLVTEILEIDETDTLLDAYAGGGLFAATVGQPAERVLAIESHPLAVRDLRRNLKRHLGDAGEVVRGTVEDRVESLDEYWTKAIVDPPRTGLGADGVAAVTAATPSRIAYVSCDPASLARDAKLLDEYGYTLEHCTPVDMFPQTFHIESVASFVLKDGTDSDTD